MGALTPFPVWGGNERKKRGTLVGTTRDPVLAHVFQSSPQVSWIPLATLPMEHLRAMESLGADSDDVSTKRVAIECMRDIASSVPSVANLSMLRSTAKHHWRPGRQRQCQGRLIDVQTICCIMILGVDGKAPSPWYFNPLLQRW